MSESDNGDTASAYVVPDSKPGRVPTKDFKPLTFNIEDVKRTMLLSADGDHTKLTKKQQGQLKTLAKLDNDGDGEKKTKKENCYFFDNNDEKFNQEYRVVCFGK